MVGATVCQAHPWPAEPLNLPRFQEWKTALPILEMRKQMHGGETVSPEVERLGLIPSPLASSLCPPSRGWD